VPRRLSRTLALLLAGAALVSAGCADDVAPAVRVGDTTLGDSQILDETEQFAGNGAILDAAMFDGDAPSTRPADLVRQVIAQRIHFELHRQLFDEAGLELSDAAVDEAFAKAYMDPDQAADVLAGFDDEGFADEYRRDVARMVILQEALGADYQATVSERYATEDIEVSPRFGDWDRARSQIVPATLPEG